MYRAANVSARLVDRWYMFTSPEHRPRAYKTSFVKEAPERSNTAHRPGSLILDADLAG